MTINLPHEVNKIMISFTFAIAKDKNDKNYERVVLQSTVNACKMLEGVMGDFLVKMIMENLRKHVLFELKCPFQVINC